jgi:ribosomal protein L40E
VSSALNVTYGRLIDLNRLSVHQRAAQKKNKGYMVCTNCQATTGPRAALRKRGYTMCVSGYAAMDTS